MAHPAAPIAPAAAAAEMPQAPNWARLGIAFGIVSALSIILWGPIGVSGTFPFIETGNCSTRLHSSTPREDELLKRDVPGAGCRSAPHIATGASAGREFVMRGGPGGIMDTFLGGF
jgi:hypothetical protein